MAKEKMFLMPGCSIGKDGLPGKKLECKTGAKPLLITDKQLKIIEPSVQYLVSQGKIKPQSEIENVQAEKEEAPVKETKKATTKKEDTSKKEASLWDKK